MKFFRWLLFLPLAAILIAVAQTISMIIAENMHWYFVAIILIFFGWIILVSSYLPSKIAPKPKIASVIILTLFILFEGGTLVFNFVEFTWTEAVVRLYIDLIIIVGAIGAYRDERNLKKIFSRQEV